MLTLDFGLSVDQKLIQETARKFAEKEFDLENILELEENKEFPSELYKKAAGEGLIGAHYYWEGTTFSMMDNVLVIEQLCTADPIGLALTLGYIPAHALHVMGTKEQKEKFLRPVINGDKTFSICATEPNFGSNLNAILGTKGKKEGDNWVINGTKNFVTNGTISDYAVVLFQSDYKSSSVKEKPYKGQSMAIVNLKSEGITRSDMSDNNVSNNQKLCLFTSPTSEIVFEDVEVPVANLLGEEGKGFRYMGRFLDESRVNIAAQSIGLAQGAFNLALKYAKEREVNGKKIVYKQSITHSLAKSIIEIESARQLTYYAARLIDEGKTDGRVSSMAKYFAARCAEKVTSRACKIHGGYAYFSDFAVSRFHRDAKVMSTYEGTEEMQLESIARDYKENNAYILHTNILDKELLNKTGLNDSYLTLEDPLHKFKAIFDDQNHKGHLKQQSVRFALSKLEADIMAAQLLICYAASANMGKMENKRITQIAEYKLSQVTDNLSSVSTKLVQGIDLKRLDEIAAPYTS